MSEDCLLALIPIICLGYYRRVVRNAFNYTMHARLYKCVQVAHYPLAIKRGTLITAMQIVQLIHGCSFELANNIVKTNSSFKRSIATLK